MAQLFLNIDDVRKALPFKNIVARYPFVAFACLALFLQIALTIAMNARVPFTGWLRVLSPLLAGIYVLWICDGTAGVLSKLKSLLVWRVHVGWYLLCFIWFPVIALVGNFVIFGFESEPLRLTQDFLSVIFTKLPHLFESRSGIRLLLICFADELSWFGIGYVLLRRTCAPLKSALIIGVLWGLAYIPIWVADIFVAEDQPLWTVLVAYVSFAIVNSWIFEKTRSAWVLMLMQLVSGNYAYNVFEVLPFYHAGDARLLIASTLIHLLAVIGLILFSRVLRQKTLLTKDIAV